MKIFFLGRTSELARLIRAVTATEPGLCIVYGRRRCGKSRILNEIPSTDVIYYLADTQESPLQIGSLAAQIAGKIPGFDSVRYPSWEAILRQCMRQSRKGMTLIIDEFPYLVKLYPPLESIIQKMVDEGLACNLILCGSSQRMMHGLVLDSAAPLYGRAKEIIKIDPLPAGWITDGLRLKGIAAFESYSVWGGIPRYWESVRDYADRREALKMLVFDKNGAFHDEPGRLLIDDARSASQALSILSLIGNGCHRLSQIAGRLGKPAVNLSKPLSQLADLGYVNRELPFGEDLKTTKRTVYLIADPFLRFWFRYINLNRSLLELGLIDQVYEACMHTFNHHVGSVWEDCARMSTAFLPVDTIQWKPAHRWWGPGTNRQPIVIDVAAESFDGKHILLGEVKWEDRVDVAVLKSELKQKAGYLPFVKGRILHYAVWAKKIQGRKPSGCCVFGPDDVLMSLQR